MPAPATSLRMNPISFVVWNAGASFTPGPAATSAVVLFAMSIETILVSPPSSLGCR